MLEVKKLTEKIIGMEQLRFVIVGCLNTIIGTTVLLQDEGEQFSF